MANDDGKIVGEIQGVFGGLRWRTCGKDPADYISADAARAAVEKQEGCPQFKPRESSDA